MKRKDPAPLIDAVRSWAEGEAGRLSACFLKAEAGQGVRLLPTRNTERYDFGLSESVYELAQRLFGLGYVVDAEVGLPVTPETLPDTLRGTGDRPEDYLVVWPGEVRPLAAGDRARAAVDDVLEVVRDRTALLSGAELELFWSILRESERSQP